MLIRQFAETMTSFLVNEKKIKHEEFEVYRYGIEQMLINVVMLIVILVTGITTGWLSESLLFVIGILPVRIYAGGFHASTPYRCSILTITVFITNLILIQFLVDKMTVVAAGMMISFVLLSVFKIGPVDNKNRELDSEGYKSTRRRSISAAIFITLICIAQLIVLGAENNLFVSTLMGAFTAAVSLIIGSIKGGGKRNDETKLCT